MPIKYELTSETKNGTYIVRLLEGEFTDIEYRYGCVSIDVEKENKLNFDYFIERDEFNDLADDDAKRRFHQQIGDILVELITTSIDTGEGLVCAGGL